MSKLDKKIAELRDEKVAVYDELRKKLDPRDIGKLNRLVLLSGHIGELGSLAHLANWQRVEDLIDVETD